MMKLAIIVILILAICILGMAIKIWAKKGGKFAGTCASQNPHFNTTGEPCSFCGRLPDETECRNNS